MRYFCLALVAAFCFASASGFIRDIHDAAGCLRAHNTRRARHPGTPLVRWDANLANGAQQFARKLASERRLYHSKGNYGENLYMSWGGSAATCEQAVEAWYNEIKLYNWNRPGFTSQTGHFTQVVWKRTLTIGLGIAYNPSRRVTCVVARYSPAGNVVGQFAANVVRPVHG